MINLSLETEVARLQHQDRLRQAEQALLYRELEKTSPVGSSDCTSPDCNRLATENANSVKPGYSRL